MCVEALEPDLVILDEFQRFKDLLHGEDEAAVLAQQLLGHKDVKAQLLSATPYRMLTLSEDTEDDHHRDFLETVRFLAQDEQVVNNLKTALGLTEQRRDAPLTRADIDQTVAVDRLSSLIGAGDAIEYWKSAPYLVSFMESYKLKERLLELRAADHDSLAALDQNTPFALRQAHFDTYSPIDPGNARLRALVADTLDAGSGLLLWLPPSVPYIAPTGPYARLGVSAATKALVFSSWHVVPKAISVLLSYEAERRMLGASAGKTSYDNLRRAYGPRLIFRMEQGKPGLSRA